MKKRFWLFAITLILPIAIIFSGCGKKNVTYAVTFDYGAAQEFFDSAVDSLTIKSTERLEDLPTIKDEYEGAFIGWFIAGTDDQKEKNDFVGGNCILEARFDTTKNAPSGLYQNGKCTKTWAMLKVEYPDATTENAINSFAFSNLSGELLIDNSIVVIKDQAFCNCSGLTRIVMPNSVTSIGECAFQSCSGLTSITIPSGVTNIGLFPFKGCTGLVEIVVEEDNTVYDSRNNCNAIIKTSTNELVVGCKNTTIPESIISIGDYAFWDCTELDSITMPNSVTSIGTNAFFGCCGLTSILISNGVTSIKQFAFCNCSGLTSITIPNSVTSIYGDAFAGCTSLESIVVEEGNTVYDSRNDCNAIIKTSTNILIAGCKNTTIPETVTSIGAYAFDTRTDITNITIPSGVTDIGIGAFEGTGLVGIIIPNTITKIDWIAFYGCSNLCTVFYTGTAEQWNDIQIGEQNTELTSATRYYYSEEEPTGEGNYWHYDTDGVTPVIWGD